MPELDKVVDLTPDSTDPQRVNWGAASDVHEGWLYVYGTRRTGEPWTTDASCTSPGRRSRTPGPEPVAVLGRPELAVAQGKAFAVLPSRGGVSQVRFVHSVDGTFAAVSKRDGDVPDYVYLWTAPHAWGPRTPRKEVKALGGTDTGQLQYAPVAHPEIGRPRAHPQAHELTGPPPSSRADAHRHVGRGVDDLVDRRASGESSVSGGSEQYGR